MKTKLIIVLVVVLGGGILWVAPDRLSAADRAPAHQKILYYTCPMHPSVRSEKPGDCPVCGMTLQPVYKQPTGTNTPPATSTNSPMATLPGCCR